jgi:hypothetical protein
LNSQGCILCQGGATLVAASDDCLGVWDLGHVSEGAISSDEKLTRVWTTRIARFTVSPTPDGLGIRILTSAYVNNLV